MTESIQDFKNHAEFLSNRFHDIDVSGFKSHKCPDCGTPLKTFHALRCRHCSTKLTGKNRKKVNQE